MTIGTVVDTIIGKLRAQGKDDRIPKRVIYNTIMETSITYHAQRLAEGSLSDEENLYTKIECVEMIPVKPSSCLPLGADCTALRRSKDKIPNIVYSKFGNSIISVTNVTDTLEFVKTNFSDISTGKKKRYSEFLNSIPKYYILEDYLYIRDYDIKAVNVKLFSLLRNDTGNDDSCTSKWDMTFVCSERMLKFVTDGALSILLTPRQLVSDENPDLNNNSKV